MKFQLRAILIFFIAIFSIQGFCQVSFQRIDPPFWWTGMVDHSLQLMVYGNQLAESNVIINYPGVELKKTSRLENPGYLVLDLEISEKARPGIMTLVFEYQREILFTIDYVLKERISGSGERNGFGKDDER